MTASTSSTLETGARLWGGNLRPPDPDRVPDVDQALGGGCVKSAEARRAALCHHAQAPGQALVAAHAKKHTGVGVGQIPYHPPA